MSENIEELKKKIAQLELGLQAEKDKTAEVEKKFNDLGLRGKAKLYYSLNRNMSDISDMLDKIKFADIDLTTKTDATMERLKMLWASVKPLAETLSILELSAKISGDEEKDTTTKNVLEFAQIRN
jgi:esterase/lipase